MGAGLAHGRAAPLSADESSARIRNEELGMRNEGGGFAANIYEAMPEDGMQVTSHESLEAIHPYFQTSNFTVRGWFAPFRRLNVNP